MLTYQHYETGQTGTVMSSISVWVTLAWGLFMTIVALSAIRQMFRPAYTLQMEKDSIALRKRELKAGKIKRIYVSEEEDPAIGIKPRGLWFVLNDCAFKFEGEAGSDSQLRELIRWAGEHQIPVIRKQAARWM
ncbi:hypothetical protein [Saccharibacillus kuerlensis]|uniref:Uncharacterized protein n=1 Tax=Saccharibacillus kuerlensis TaxID=459527 RepID=A0ABQ2KRJ3_9BACL|nr:hypothetical protein [Saccharibacillus kuerlensis]GGN91171.1 hypothetical protein GCM10010969_02500 [Saccharibacillus kuerlensis]